MRVVCRDTRRELETYGTTRALELDKEKLARYVRSLGVISMKQRTVGKAIKSWGLAVALCVTGAANAKTIDLGDLQAGANYSFTDVVTFGQSFTDYVGFSVSGASQLQSFIKSFDLSIMSLDLLGIDNFSATLQQLGSGGFQTISLGSGTSMSFDDLLGAGDYRIALSGVGSGLFGGIYRGSLQVAAVPEADVWIMLLVGFVLVTYQLRRKQRTLETQPLAAA
jgi:hypothetical protein